MSALQRQGQAAKSAAYILSTAGTAKKNAALEAIAKILTERRQEWLSANREDVAAAESAGMRPALLDRLTLTEERVAEIVEGVRQIIALPDPIGRVDRMETRPNGLIIGRRRVPLGVVAIIFEARPNVTVDAAALCLKSGNVAVLRGGSDAINSNKRLVSVMRSALSSAGVDENAVSLVEDTSRECVSELLKLNRYIDVLIPRGGHGLIQNVINNSTIPVIQTGEGNCSVYVDRSADITMAVNIADNGKTQRPSVCNAIENLLVHEEIAEEFLKALDEKWKGKVRIYADESASKYINADREATEEDYKTEFLDYVISIKTVKDVSEAINFINRYGTRHSECIVTNDIKNAELFKQAVDAAAVYVNASTRFTDGGEFGLGAEIGISTQKLHARGPMGLEEMTTYKYLIDGSGQIR